MRKKTHRGAILPRSVLAAALVCAAVAASTPVLASTNSSSAACTAMDSGGTCTMDMSGSTGSLPACCQGQADSAASKTAAAKSASSQTSGTAVCSMTGMEGDTSSTSSKDNCDFGAVDILSVPDKACGLDEFQKIQGKTRHTATFEKADASGNVAYSWTFKGTDIAIPANINMNIDVSKEGALTDAVEQVVSSYGQTMKNAVYLHLAQSGVLPGKVLLMIATNGQFAAKDTVNVYYYNEDKNRIEPVALGVKPENGYVSFTISHASDYFLTVQKLNIPFWSQIKSWQVIVLAVMLGAAAGILTPLLLKRKTHKKDIKQ
ncbi:MAG: hypothetical protein ABF449_10245 [Ethanoligenens sp.]